MNSSFYDKVQIEAVEAAMLKKIKRLGYYFYSAIYKNLNLDTKFYKSYYADLRGFVSERELKLHYIQHGKREGRFRNAAELIEDLQAHYGSLPDDFVASQYRLRHPDLSAMRDTWTLIEHYLRFGRSEKREYTANIADIEEEYKNFIYSKEKAHSAYAEKSRHESFTDLLDSVQVKSTAWVHRFNLYEFVILNRNWLPHRPVSRMEGLSLFLTVGIERLAPLALGEEFEPAFYRQQGADTMKSMSDVDLYRDWLSNGIGAGLKSNEGKALLDFIGDAQFPPSFDDLRYRRAIGRAATFVGPGRYNALVHYVNTGFAIHEIDVLDRTKAAPLVERIAEFHLAAKNFEVSLRAFDWAITLSPDAGRLHHRRGDCLAALGRTEAATESFVAACKLPGSNVWSHINAIQGLIKGSTDLDNAIEFLRESAQSYHGSPAWRKTALEAIDRLFQSVSEAAFDLHRCGHHDEADSLMVSVLERTEDLIRSCDPLPGKLVRRSTGHVVLIANQDLSQCNYYRVQQRERQLVAGGWSVEIINHRNVASAHPEIDKSSVVIFYRVAASPALLHAILYARALGVATIYDIDDLIFDPRFYPEPFETYEGQISQEEYLSLRFGVPLFRYAIQACDIGLTSTAVLADLLRPLVRSHQCYVLRNGFDQRNDDFLNNVPESFSKSAVTVFYGSGTKAHSLDFSEIIAPALIDLLANNSKARLALAGYVPLDARFDQYRSRIVRMGFTADVRAYWEFLSGVDVNVAVLSRNPATDAKSEIKWLEAAMFGIPSIVSPTATYQDVLIHGEDCLFAETSLDWADALQRLTSDAELRLQIGSQARRKALDCYSLSAAEEVLKQFIPQRDFSLPPRGLSITTKSSELPHLMDLQRRRGTLSGAKKRHRILIVNVYFPPHTFGGATRVVRDNVDYYIDHASDEFEIAVLATDHSSHATYQTRVDSYRGIPVFRIGTPVEVNMDWRPFNNNIVQPMETLIRQFDPDLVHFHCIQQLTGTTVEIVDRLNIPYIVTCHDAWWISDFQFLLDEDGELQIPSPDPLASRYGRAFSPIESIARRRKLGRLLNNAERVLCVSDSFSKIYEDAGVKKVKSVPNGVPILKNMIARKPSASGRVRLGHIGGRTTHKGATLIETVLRRNAFPNLELTLVDHARTEGDAYQEIWGETRTTIVGFMPQDKVADMYAGLDVLLAPSIWPESFGLVTREAIAMGLWVVASDRGAIGEDVIEGVNGFIINVNTPDDLARALAEINDDPAKYLNAPVDVGIKRRSVADQCREILECYRSVLAAE